MIPLILTHIADFLCRNMVQLGCAEDGRLASAIDERRIIDRIAENFTIQTQPQPRHWWDFAVEHEGVFYPVNVKITELSSAADNMNCKLGIYYALTGQLPTFANETRWRDFFRLLSTGICDNNRDYYLLVINKNRSADVFMQGLKTLSVLQANGNNLPFQCRWRDNREPLRRSFPEARDFLLGTLAQSVRLRAEIYFEFHQYFPQYSGVES